MLLRRSALAFAAMLVSTIHCAAAQAAELVQVTESVWRVRGDRPGAAVASVVVSPSGLMVIDSTCRSEGDAAWLKGELQRRFNQPVRYVVLSHDHEDHICNLDVFDDTAITIAHERTREHIVRENRNTSIPSITFDTRATVWLGDKEIQILHFGPSHSDNLVQVYVPSERVLIAPDFMQRGQGLFPDFRDMDIDGMLRTWNYVYRMLDIDVIINGHGEPSPREEILNNIRYVSALRERVLQEMVNGKSLPEMMDTIQLPEFANWRGYDRLLRGNIATMWYYLYGRREPNLGPAHDAWQNVEAVILQGAAEANNVRPRD